MSDSKEPTERKPLVIEYEIVTVDVLPEVRNAIEECLSSYTGELDEALSPFGLSTMDIAAPKYRRIVFEDEVSDV